MTTTTNIQDRLARLSNYRTRYELIAEKDGRKVLVCYSSGRGRRDIFSILAKRHEAFTKLTGATEIHWAKRASDGGTANGWTIRFSGRTQRECIIEGELEYIGGL